MSEGARKASLLSVAQVKALKQISSSKKDHSSHAQALLLVHAGSTQIDAASESKLSVGQVRYWVGKFRRLGMDAFASNPTSSKKASSTNKKSSKKSKPVKKSKKAAKQSKKVGKKHKKDSGKSKKEVKKSSKKSAKSSKKSSKKTTKGSRKSGKKSKKK